MLLAARAAWAVTFQYDNLDRLIKATYQNGTVIEYAYDATGNRLQKKIQSPLPPEVMINTAGGPFGPYTWNNEQHHFRHGCGQERNGPAVRGDLLKPARQWCLCLLERIGLGFCGGIMEPRI